MNFKPINMTARHLSLLLFLALTLSACAGISERLSGKSPEELDEANVAAARRLVAALDSQNSTLQYFKGIGKIKVWNNRRIQIDERLAWVGSKPEKISIAVLVSGFPAVKMATDGQWFYYLEMQGEKAVFKKIKASNASLERLIAVPIYTQDIITLLAGRVPLPEHHSAYIQTDPETAGSILVLKRRWWGIVEKIYLDGDQDRVRRIEVFNRSGSVVYRIDFNNIKEIDGYRIPFQFRIASKDGIDCELNIDRYWTNVSVSPSVFVLAPPE